MGCPVSSPIILETNIEKIVAENVAKEVKLIDAQIGKLYGEIDSHMARRAKLEKYAEIEGVALPAHGIVNALDPRD